MTPSVREKEEAMGKSGGKSLTIIGAHPPTLGGVSIHVQRLAALAVRLGLRVQVVDPYTIQEGTDEAEYGYCVCRRAGRLGRVRMLAELFVQPAAIAHIHLSHAGNVAAFVVVVLAAGRSRRVVTIHSGSFPAQLAQHSQSARRMLGWSLSQCVSIICVSERLKAALAEVFPHLASRCLVEPAFLPGPKAEPAPPSPDGRLRVLAAGYGTPTYDWHTLLDALEGDLSRLDLHLVFYTTYAPEYFPNLIERIARYGTSVSVHRDLSQEAFASLLASARVFARPTRTDGDSIALREALALGVQVVASDACLRPGGVRLFPVGDAGALRREILAALSAEPVEPGAAREIERTYLEAYEMTGAGGQPSLARRL
jgi:glycogen synthase